ncbi:MAG: ribosome silencing factor [Holosporales bacterium]|nr:ribosome silencing factor [Holosporales bacterium]
MKTKSNITVGSQVLDTNLIPFIVAFLDDHKVENIVTIDLLNKSVMSDCLIIGSGRSQKHVRMSIEILHRELSKQGHKHIVVEGLPNSDWVLLDVGSVIVHLFTPEMRGFYNLEKMWSSDLRPSHQQEEKMGA